MMADSRKHRHGTSRTSATISPQDIPHPPPPSCSASSPSARLPLTARTIRSVPPTSGRMTSTTNSSGAAAQHSSQTRAVTEGRPPAPSPPDSVGEHHFYDTTLLDREEGYDYDFVPATDNKYECPICLLVLRGTVQTPCGHRFCTACICRWLSDTGGPKCPVCNEAITENQLFPDKFADREIMSFTVRCPNNKYGCESVSELKHLDEHLADSCDFVLAPCPNHCSSVLFKKDIEWHRNKECVKREIICDLCGIRVPTAEKHKHKLVCLEESVDCQYCHIPVLRKQVQSHLEKCDMAPAHCVFNPLGCKAELTRSDMAKHNESQTQYHLNLTARVLNSLLQLQDQHTHIFNRIPLVNTQQQLMLQQQNETMDKNCNGKIDTVEDTAIRFQQLQLEHGKLSQSAKNLDDHEPLQQRVRVASEGSCATSENFGIGGEIDSVALSNLSTTPFLTTNTAAMAMSFNTSQQTSIADSRFLCTSIDVDNRSPPYVNMPHSDPSRLKQDNKASLRQQLSCEESLRLAGEGGVDFLEKSRQQEASVARQKQLILELQAKVASLESRLGEQAHSNKTLKDKIVKQEDSILNFEGRNCKGLYIWKIREFSRLRQEAIHGQTTVLHSPGFYTSFYGYKLCVRANLNGVEGGNGSHISIFIHFMRGDYDDILEWPFRGKIILTVMDQGEHRQHVTEILESKPSLAAFQRPLSNRNHKGFGYIEFAPVAMIERSTYVLNDTLIIKADVSESQC